MPKKLRRNPQTRERGDDFCCVEAAVENERCGESTGCEHNIVHSIDTGSISTEIWYVKIGWETRTVMLETHPLSY
jgi:hypothetical protein